MPASITRPSSHCRPLLAAVAALLIPSAIVAADKVKNVRTEATAILAPRGGVMMIPLTAERQGSDWPASLTLKLADGREITGLVAWVHRAAPRMERRWTDDPRSLAIRPIEPADDTSRPGSDGAAFLLAELPTDGTGRIRLGSQTLTPTWLIVPDTLGLSLLADDLPFADRPFLERVQADDRPDPDSPFEYWRWVLLADRLVMQPPPFQGNNVAETLLARHLADAWRIALARLAAQSRGVAGQCRDLLTQTATDRDHPFAAWLTDPTAIATLLSTLLNFDRDDRTVMESALTWADTIDLTIIWPESDAGDRIKLLAVNPDFDRAALRLGWKDAGIRPISATIEPGVLATLELNRPPQPETPLRNLPSARTAPDDALLIERDRKTYLLPVRPRWFAARPPGVALSPLAPPPTLAEARDRLANPIDNARVTLTTIRRSSGRWEVFFECWRPNADSASANLNARALADLADYTQTVGMEALTLLIGHDQSSPSEAADPATSGPRIILTVPMEGWHRLFEGSNDGSLQIHRRAYADRWYCRIVLPDNWFVPTDAGPTYFGFVRTHGDSMSIETGPSTTFPWRFSPGRVGINLAHWDR